MLCIMLFSNQWHCLNFFNMYRESVTSFQIRAILLVFNCGQESSASFVIWHHLTTQALMQLVISNFLCLFIAIIYVSSHNYEVNRWKSNFTLHNPFNKASEATTVFKSLSWQVEVVEELTVLANLFSATLRVGPIWWLSWL